MNRNLLGIIVAIACATGVRMHALTLQPGDVVVGAGFTASDGGLIVVDPTTGNRTILSDNSHGTGPDFSDPTSVTFASDGSLLVADTVAHELFRVDPTTGNRSIITSTNAGNPVGNGPSSSFVGARQFGSELVLSGGALLYVDPATGNRAPIPGGPPSIPGSSEGFALSGTILIYADQSANAIQRLDTVTETVTTVSGGGVGGGPAFGNALFDVEIDGNNQLLTSIELGPIMRVDPSTGNRSIVSGSGVGTGPSMDGIGGEIGIASNGLLFYGGALSHSLLEIDPATGNRTIVADATHGTGAAFVQLTAACAVVPNVPEPASIVPLAIGGLGLIAIVLGRLGKGARRRFVLCVFIAVAIQARRAQAVTLEPGDIVVAANLGSNSQPDNALVVVDPTTGDRTIISDNTHGTGPAFQGAHALSFESDGSILLTGQGTLYRIDPTTGNRSILSGSGPANSFVEARQFGDEIVLSGNALLYVDPASGNRTPFPGGAGLSSEGFTISGSDLLVANAGSANTLLRIDATTGTQTILSGAGVGSGPAIVGPIDVEFDRSGSLLLAQLPAALSPGEILRVDPLTGNRTLLTGGGIGSGPGMGDFGSQIAVEANGTILSADAGYASLLAIDPTTGNRTVLSDATHGTGPVWQPTGLGLPLRRCRCTRACINRARYPSAPSLPGVAPAARRLIAGAADR